MGCRPRATARHRRLRSPSPRRRRASSSTPCRCLTTSRAIRSTKSSPAHTRASHLCDLGCLHVFRSQPAGQPWCWPAATHLKVFFDARRFVVSHSLSACASFQHCLLPQYWWNFRHTNAGLKQNDQQQKWSRDCRFLSWPLQAVRLPHTREKPCQWGSGLEG